MRRILIIVAAFVFAVPAFASVDQDLWQYAKEIHTSGSGVTVVELDVRISKCGVPRSLNHYVCK